ncbi:MAG: putative DNA modification/repair radical SAM protein [Lachnospiraceae bacterium]|nr:putative DNA modification/repair radical SAM protein [Lachnospiraceae bacterium]
MYDLSTNDTLKEKLIILSDAAKYDVACTSSGVSRGGKEGFLGNSVAAGVCHAFSADGRCISLLKILMTNHCIYDCKYCKNRASNDIERALFTPEEICTLTIEFYKRNYIEGLFLSSGVYKNPDYTMEKICETLRLLRTKYKFNGYIHVKAIPGASEELLYSAGLLADRISINMELPTEQSLNKLAPNKTMTNIIEPMNRISGTIAGHRVAIGKSARMERCGINKHLVNSIFGPEAARIEGSSDRPFLYPAERNDALLRRPFAPAGQSTQMIIGASDETDLELIRTTQALYQSFDLKRVFYSAYIPINDDELLPGKDAPVPLLREHRLYQADWLLRYYGFGAEEILTKDNPFLDYRVDPKCFWALNHLDIFPVEINRAPVELLLRVPGIGPTSVKRIISARRYGNVNFEMLKRMHVVLKRAQYFITCNGKMLNRTPIEQRFIMGQLTDLEHREVYQIEDSLNTGRQMSLFSDCNLELA